MAVSRGHRKSWAVPERGGMGVGGDLRNMGPVLRKRVGVRKLWIIKRGG